MQFAVIEKNDTSEILIGYVKSHEEFKNLIFGRYKDSKILDSVGIDDIKYNSCFKNDSYLLFNGNTIHYLTKSSTVKKGYVYNSTKSETKLLMSWKLIECRIGESSKSFTSDQSSTNSQPLSLSFKKFDLKSMPSYPQICMIGMRGSGKTFLVSDILDSVDSELLSNCLIISPTDRMNPFYAKKYPNAKILDKLDYEEIKRFLQVLPDTQPTPGVIVLDDCLSSKGDWIKNETMMELFYNSRHYNKMLITTMQYPLGIPPEIRYNFDYVYLFAEGFFSNQKRLYDHYTGMFPDVNSFRQVLNKLTENYGSMVIKQKGVKKDIRDKIFWYRYKIKEN